MENSVRFSSSMQITAAHLIQKKTWSLQWSIGKLEQKKIQCINNEGEVGGNVH